MKTLRDKEGSAMYFLVIVLMLAACTLRSSEEIRQDVDRIVMEPFRRWENTSPVDCMSKDLFDSVRLARYMGSYAKDLSMKQQSAAYQLEIADGALRKNCVQFAEVLYREIISMYVGLAYTAHRQRAEIGLADIRELRRRP